MDHHAAQAGGPMPDGALIAKQGWADAEATDKRNLTVMYKIDQDYGWFWASWNAAGEPLLQGQPSACTNCHAAGQDEVLVTTW